MRKCVAPYTARILCLSWREGPAKHGILRLIFGLVFSDAFTSHSKYFRGPQKGMGRVFISTLNGAEEALSHYH